MGDSAEKKVLVRKTMNFQASGRQFSMLPSILSIVSSDLTFHCWVADTFVLLFSMGIDVDPSNKLWFSDLKWGSDSGRFSSATPPLCVSCFAGRQTKYREQRIYRWQAIEKDKRHSVRIKYGEGQGSVEPRSRWGRHTTPRQTVHFPLYTTLHYTRIFWWTGCSLIDMTRRYASYWLLSLSLCT